MRMLLRSACRASFVGIRYPHDHASAQIRYGAAFSVAAAVTEHPSGIGFTAAQGDGVAVPLAAERARERHDGPRDDSGDRHIQCAVFFDRQAGSWFDDTGLFLGGDGHLFREQLLEGFPQLAKVVATGLQACLPDDLHNLALGMFHGLGRHGAAADLAGLAGDVLGIGVLGSGGGIVFHAILLLRR